MGKSKGKDRVKYRLCGLCGSHRSDTVRLRIYGDKYLALYEDKLVPCQLHCPGAADKQSGKRGRAGNASSGVSPPTKR